MIAASPLIIVVVLLFALVSLVVVPGAALLSIPLVVVFVVALVVLGVRAVASGRGGARVDHQEPGRAVDDALSPPGTGRDTAAASREQTQG